MANDKINHESKPHQDVSGVTSNDQPLHIGKPAWLKTPIPSGNAYFKTKKNLRDKKLFTVCEEAKCPNIGGCWTSNTATFMILGGTCTRACRFCHVATGNPGGITDPQEPQRVADSVRDLSLKYVVITMVNRDEMEDGGASHVAAVLNRVREVNPAIIIEFLGGDFAGRDASLRSVLESRPEVFAHNIETVDRLTHRVRDRRAGYALSLEVLAQVKKLADYPVLTKSSIMVGLGETNAEVENALRDLREANVDFVTIGQYMRPTKQHLSIKRFATPEEFTHWESVARKLGFRSVASGPLVRSSYRAREFFETAQGTS